MLLICRRPGGSRISPRSTTQADSFKTTALIATTTLALSACVWSATSAGSTPSAAVTDPWANLRRALTVSQLQPGSPCPIAASRLATQVDPAFDPGETPELYRAFGSGPAYPIIYNLNQLNAVEISAKSMVGGWYVDKVLWIISPEYRGPILVRGEQLDGGQQVHFAASGFEPSPPDWNLPELHISGVTSEDPAAWRDAGSEVLIPGPGCYALQIDYVHLTEVIFFKAN